MKNKINKQYIESVNLYDYRKSNYSIQNWYRIVEGFSTDFVEDKLRRHGMKQGKNMVLDPHSGAGTTALVCKCLGIDCISIDANPWCYMVAKCKTDWNVDLIEFHTIKNKIISKLPIKLTEQEKLTGFVFMEEKQSKLFPLSEDYAFNSITNEIPIPLLPRIDQKISKPILDKVLYLKRVITETIATHSNVNESITMLLWFALGAKLMDISNMTWYGPKVTWRKKPYYDAPVFNLYKNSLDTIEKDLSHAQKTIGNKSKTKIILGDSRHVDNYIEESKIDLAVTSPPYMNEACYCDQSQFQLYFLDFVKDMGDLKEVKKRMLTCNTKYVFKDSNDSNNITDFSPVMDIYENLRQKEKREEKNWGWNRPKMLIEYFGGMKMHLESMYDVLREGATYSIIIGDSAIAGVHIPTDSLIIDIGKELGYSHGSLDIFRKRSSSRHTVKLRESLVTLIK